MIVAVLPAALAACFSFGAGSVAVAVLSAVLAGALSDRVRGSRPSLESAAWDLAGGTLLLLCLPAPPPLLLASAGAVAVAVVARISLERWPAPLFQPVALTRLAMLLLLPALMDQSTGVDVISGATPLGFWRVEEFSTFSAGAYSTDLLLGYSAGAAAEGLGLPLVIGALILLVSGSIGWALPVAFVAATVAVTGGAWLLGGTSFPSPVYHLLNGELFLGAFFLAADPRTSFSTGRRGLAFGLAGGALYACLRLSGLLAFSVALSVLALNLIHRLLAGRDDEEPALPARKSTLRFRFVVVAGAMALIVSTPLVIDEILAAAEVGEDVDEDDAYEKKTGGITSAGPAAPLDWVSSEAAGVLFTRTEVTVAQFAECVRKEACSPSTFEIAQGRSSAQEGCNAGQAGRDRHPMNCVTWDGARIFCRFANGRLPTSHEWTAEATAVGKQRYPWGDEEPSCERAVWGGGPEGEGCGEARTSPVCSRPAGNSAAGLCDMVGNAAEWMAEEWEPWTETRESEQYHLLRGGGWSFRDLGSHDPSSSLRLRKRFRGFGAVGFRCVKAAE